MARPRDRESALLLEIGLRWGTRLAMAATAGAVLGPIAVNPDGVAACVPPTMPVPDLACLGDAGFALAGAIAVVGLVLGAAGAVLRAWQARKENLLLAAGVRAAVIRARTEAQESHAH